MTRRAQQAAEHRRLILAVAFAPRGQKLCRQAELRAWVRSQLEREIAIADAHSFMDLLEAGERQQLELWAA